MKCQHGTSVYKVHVNCISDMTFCYLLTHLGCIYSCSMQLPQYNNLHPLSCLLLGPTTSNMKLPSVLVEFWAIGAVL
jgi:hypothetical protein